MKNSLLELFFPRFCIGCGYVGAYICPTCEAAMKRTGRPRCFYCRKPSLLGMTHPSCKHKNGIDGFLSLYRYEGLFKKILQESKYRGAYTVLTSLLSFPQQSILQDTTKWRKLFNPHSVSVPLHPQRIRERGFNQSEIISTHYFDNMFPREPLLTRVINTEHLANIGDRTKRKKHIHGAFKYVGNKTPSTVIIVDDVVTSGSTILECCHTLKENGVQTVLAFSLARG